jgi:D-alanyl-D-alanine carboxypeptidase
MRKYVLMIVLALCCVTPAKALEVSAHSAILMDGDSGQVLYEKDPDERSLIASTTKIMTALVTLEQAELAETVEIPEEAVGIEGSSMYLKAGEQLTVEDLLYGMMLSSGNDAAVALALYVSGSIEDFAAAMNEKARELGLSNAHFANPNGLDSQENYASARDLAYLAAAAMENPDFYRIVSAKSYQCAGHDLTNHNKLLWQYDGAVGIKTGYTKQAGRILVGCAERNGRRLISVTIHAPDDWQDHKAMLDYGFSQYQEQVLVQEGQLLGSVPVISGQAAETAVLAGGTVRAYVLTGEVPEVKLYLPEFVYAPVEADAVLGSATILIGEKSVGEIPLLAKASVEILPEERSLWQRMKEKISVWGSAPYIIERSGAFAGTCAKDFSGLRCCITAQGRGADLPRQSVCKWKDLRAGRHR